jgi:hypothetical protein
VNIIADFPAYTIVEPEDRCFKHGDQIAIPFTTRTGGTLYRFYTLGTIEGYAVENGEDPMVAIEECERNMRENPYQGHKRYWANQNATVISDGSVAKRTIPGLDYGDIIRLQGKNFLLKSAPNNNIDLVEILSSPERLQLYRVELLSESGTYIDSCFVRSKTGFDARALARKYLDKKLGSKISDSHQYVSKSIKNWLEEDSDSNYDDCLKESIN